VITGPHTGEVQDVPEPVAAADEVVVDVSRVGVCGTDEELFSGDMPYLHDGRAWYPLRIGHEWCGVVSAVGRDVDESWLGKRVTGDTMIGDQTCRRCREGRHWVCENLEELGISKGRAGALAEQVAVPERALRQLPEQVDDAMGALVEPGGNSWRAAKAAAVEPGDRLLIMGAGTIGLLAAMFARADGADVHLLGHSPRSVDFARSLGFSEVWTADTLPELPWDAVIDASNSPKLPSLAVQLVEPSKRVVYIGLAPAPSNVDTRDMVLKDMTAVGILSGSPGLDGAIAAYTSGSVDPRPLVGAVVAIDEVADVLAGNTPASEGWQSTGPKVHVQIAKESAS
jgi:threonine dehydrogenase-like Zn-dependent dehydrogenase